MKAGGLICVFDLCFGKLGSQNKISRFLCLRCCLHNQGLVASQLLKPVFKIRCRIINCALSNPGLTTKKSCSHFRNQLLLAIRI